MNGYQRSGSLTSRVVLKEPVSERGVEWVSILVPEGERMVSVMEVVLVEGDEMVVCPDMMIFARVRSGNTFCRTRNCEIRDVKSSRWMGFQGPEVLSAGPH